jgi:hypothetical protein
MLTDPQALIHRQKAHHLFRVCLALQELSTLLEAETARAASRRKIRHTDDPDEIRRQRDGRSASQPPPASPEAVGASAIACASTPDITTRLL